MFLTLIRAFWSFIFLALGLFLLGVLLNTVLQVPAEGVQRLVAFLPFFGLFALKAWTMWRD